MHFTEGRQSTKFAKVCWKKLSSILMPLTMIIISFLCFWLVLRVLLNTEYPILPVPSQNMCIARSYCDSWRDLFAPTLHVGDLIIVQGVDASSVKVSYPNSDVVVFHAPKQDPSQEDWFIITRVVAREESNGIIYFRTKSDGEGLHTWPQMPDVSETDLWFNDYRGENYTQHGMISEKVLIGKVIMRIPLLGHIALFIQDSSFSILVIVFVIIALTIIGFVIPTFKTREVKAEQT